MDQRACSEMGFTRPTVEAFAEGFPEDWRSFLSSETSAEAAAARRRKLGKRRLQDAPEAVSPRLQRAKVAIGHGRAGYDGDGSAGDRDEDEAPGLAATATASSRSPAPASGAQSTQTPQACGSCCVT